MASHDDSYLAFALTQTLRHRRYLRELPWEATLDERYGKLVAESRVAQHKIEAADALDFESYRQQYLALELSAP
jgi:glutamate--cysteine ligase